MAFINTIYKISQFVVNTPLPDEFSTTLSCSLIYYVLMKLDLYDLVVLDSGSPFKGVFIAKCQHLKLNCDILNKHNHKGLTVAHY